MAAATLPSPSAPDVTTPPPTASHFPAALKDRAFDLYSHGFRSPAIAAELGVSERTVRHWLQTTIQQLAQDDATASPEITRQQRALAVESQRAVAATAWTAYHQLSDAYTHLMTRALAPTNSQPERLLASINRLAATAARHLAVITSANREIARLQGQAVAQATRDQRAASQQSAADDAAELLRILTTPIPTPSARPSTLDTLPPLHNTPTTPDTPTTSNLPTILDTHIPDIPRPDGLPAPDFPPLPDHIIAAVMNHYRKMYPDDPDGPDGPDDAIAAAPRLAGHAPLPRTAEGAQTPPKTKIAAKTATPPRPKNKPNHQPAIAIPSRTARKLKKVHAA